MPPEAYPVAPRGFFLWGLRGGRCGDRWGPVLGRAGTEVSGGVNGLGLRDNGRRYLIIGVFATFYVILLLLLE